MWSVVLKILSIVGIILLCLLVFLLLVLFMVLFLPVVYRGGGKAHDGAYEAWFRFRWLFGLIRGEFTCPGGKALRIKVLWLTVYDSGRKRGKEPENAKEAAKEDLVHEAKPVKEAAGKTEETDRKAAEPEKAAADTPVSTAKAAGDTLEDPGKTEQTAGNREETDTELGQQEGPNGGKGAVPASEKSSRKSARKLSEWKDRLQDYLSVIQDKDNQDLVKHALNRLGKLLKSIRPRVLRAEAVVGLGEPDTTGYFYGAYQAIRPFLGKKCRVMITPDFERQILEGKIALRGKIVAVVLLYHIIRVALDKRLQKLLRSLRNLK